MPLPPIFVINLARSPDRWARVTAQLANRGLGCVRIEAVDATLLTADELLAASPSPLNRTLYHKELTPGEIACYLSHRRAWQEIVARGLGGAVVLEDDVLLGRDFTAALAELERIPLAWDVIKLGSRSTKPLAARTSAGRFSLCAYRKVPISAFAQAVSRAGAEKLLNARPAFGRPVDVDLQFPWETGVEVLGLEPYPVTFDSACGSEITGAGTRRAPPSRRLTFLAQRLAFLIRNARHTHRRYGWQAVRRELPPVGPAALNSAAP